MAEEIFCVLFVRDQVCRFCQQQDDRPTCFVCGTTENLWVCVICGFVGCGRYSINIVFLLAYFLETLKYQLLIGSEFIIYVRIHAFLIFKSSQLLIFCVIYLMLKFIAIFEDTKKDMPLGTGRIHSIAILLT